MVMAWNEELPLARLLIIELLRVLVPDQVGEAPGTGGKVPPGEPPV